MNLRVLLTSLLLLLPSLANADETVKVTFAEHIAPIVHAKCTMCHRKGQSGPFELLTYEDVREQAATIQAVVHDDYMPPWKLVNTNIDFANDRRLTPQEKTLLNLWVESGMPAWRLGFDPTTEVSRRLESWRAGSRCENERRFPCARVGTGRLPFVCISAGLKGGQMD